MNTRYNYKIIVILLTGCFVCVTTKTCFGLWHSNNFYEGSFSDSIYSENIRTVVLRNAEWELSQPVILLNSDQQLELLFDELSGQVRYFGYTLIHCDHKWNPSPVSQQQYLEGFGEGEIREMHGSFNTTVDYINYRLVFPEENTKPLISGNYVIVVYDLYDPEMIILTRRFYVLERQLEVEGQISRAPPGAYYESGQYLEFSVIDQGNIVRDPHSDLVAVVKQNGRSDNTVFMQKPQYIGPDRFDYAFSDQLVFQGGNEFRNFDTKSLKYLSEQISEIDFVNPYYHIFLKPDNTREHEPYFFKQDMNGAFYIDKEKAVEKNQEADYVYVHFTLNRPRIFTEETVYVFGMLSDWALKESNRMEYNPDKDYFELTLLLKQGWYDYSYIATNPLSKTDYKVIEGNHHETSNTYSIYIYHRNTLEAYDQLSGFLSISAP